MSAVTASPPAMSRAKQTQVHVQRFGAFLTGMIMPNLPAFVAWGLITSLFIAAGWAPNGILGGFGNADVAGSWQGAATALATAADGTTFHQYLGLVGPMIVYLLPLLIANQGGRIVYGERGGVVASIATMGVIVGSTIPMFLGAMIVGPLAAWLMKKIDSIWDGKIRPGFEMLVNMYSAGILGMGLAIAAFFGIAPFVTNVSSWLGSGVQSLADAHLLPLMSIIVEPAKVLFLNNAIGNGTLVPLGIQQSADTGQSLLFLVEANPGPGFGLLLAFTLFGIGAARASAPGAIIIQFIGGIHEVYFPFVLMKPALIIGLIAGGATGVATNAVLGSGLRAPGFARQHHRGARADTEGQLRRRHPLGGALGRCDVPDQRGDPAGLAQAGPRRRGGRPCRRDRADRGQQGQVVRCARCTRRAARARLAPRPRSPPAARCAPSSSRATPVWGPVRWVPACCGPSSRRRGSRTSRWSTRPSPTSPTTPRS